MLRPFLFTAVFTCFLAGCAHDIPKDKATQLGEQLDGTTPSKNAFDDLKANKFDSWAISPRKDIPMGQDGKLPSPK